MPPERRWEPLDETVGVYTAPGFTFGTDALLLAQFALRSVPRARRLADLGTGCGVIPVRWAQARPNAAICAIELQSDGAALAVAGVQRSGVADRVQVICGDLRTWTVPPSERFDLVACNPPYFRSDAGASAPDAARRIARTDGTCTLRDAAAAAARLLHGTGWYCTILRVERLCEAIDATRGAGLEPKRLQLVQADAAHAPKLALLAARRNGRPGLTVEPTRMLGTAVDSHERGGNVENSV